MPRSFFKTTITRPTSASANLPFLRHMRASMFCVIGGPALPDDQIGPEKQNINLDLGTCPARWLFTK
jgi:hypothetical protein